MQLKERKFLEGLALKSDYCNANGITKKQSPQVDKNDFKFLLA